MRICCGLFCKCAFCGFQATFNWRLPSAATLLCTEGRARRRTRTSDSPGLAGTAQYRHKSTINIGKCRLFRRKITTRWPRRSLDQSLEFSTLRAWSPVICPTLARLGAELSATDNVVVTGLSRAFDDRAPARDIPTTKIWLFCPMLAHRRRYNI